MIDDTFLTAFGHRLTQMIQTEDDPRDTKDEKVTIFHGTEVPEMTLASKHSRVAKKEAMGAARARAVTTLPFRCRA